VNVQSFDMNLLVAFDALIEHRSVTRAGAALNLSQPAMSSALGRLRVSLADPLFVRSGSEMRPTARALELAGPVRRLLDIASSEILMGPIFDAVSSRRTFTVIMPDIAEMTMVPALLDRLAAEAPGLTLHTMSQPLDAAAPVLGRGAADLAIGYFPDLDTRGFVSERLFDNPYVCVARADHPDVRGAISLPQFLAASHVVVYPDGREHLVDSSLRQRGIERRTVTELAHFMSLLPILGRTDLIATVPRDLAEVCATYVDVQILPVPFDAPVITVRQTWHQSADQDPANRWFRDVVRSVLRRP
jgi:DNA-binding transcriptional LysR family regulator